jgi:tetratricopeptide (TPR) repeat protein
MADKKKLSPVKTEKRITNLPVSPENPGDLDGRGSAKGLRSVTHGLPATNKSEAQLADFEAASKLFHARKFREAHDLFLRAAEGPERDVAHRARLHAAMCAQRFQQSEVRCETVEDHYNYGVALLNARKVEEARSHLERALQMAPDSEHIHYALAGAHALTADTARAYEHLKRAIELDPKNRIMARQDGDFAPVAGQAQFQALLYPEKKSW